MMVIFSMKLIRLFKRLYYRLINSDPVKNCPVYKDEGCAFVDCPYCNISNCLFIDKLKGDKWVGCAICAYQDACSNSNFGIGCYNGEKEKEEK